jgi:glycosyltransferase involved in cell wall biosynthesis
MARRILYVQFTDPAAYPPIEHSAVLLAERGWEVLFLGTVRLSELTLELASHPRIRVRRMAFVRPGWKQKLNYITFCLWVLYWVLRWRPQWIYASDPLVAPLVYLVQHLTKTRVIYHEHDSPNLSKLQSGLMSKVYAYRKIVGGEADLCVLPQHERLHDFVEYAGRTKPTFCVWNFPRIDEIPPRDYSQGSELLLYYHGSINRARLPVQLVIAASRLNQSVRFRITGYETEPRYVEQLKKVASKSGAAQLIDYYGVVLRRKDLLRHAAQAHIGLVLIPKHSDDINLRHMVGASNKAFDYMACGLPLLVSDLPEWVATFVKPGYALQCDPDDADSIESALRWYIENPSKRSEMGRNARQKIQKVWNYNTAFGAVLAEIESTSDLAR